jgi:hypothetical protein
MRDETIGINIRLPRGVKPAVARAADNDDRSITVWASRKVSQLLRTSHRNNLTQIVADYDTDPSEEILFLEIRKDLYETVAGMIGTRKPARIARVFAVAVLGALDSVPSL